VRLRALGPPPADGPFAAPPGIEAGPAGDRAHAPPARLSTDGRALHDRFVAALDDDLDLPVALAVVREMLRAPLPEEERRWLVLDADAVLGLDLDRAWSAGPAASGEPEAAGADVEALLTERSVARAARDFARADALRAEIEALGWDVVDGPAGSRVDRRAGASRAP
jgi:cysteinyl-tRNA synthetase